MRSFQLGSRNILKLLDNLRGVLNSKTFCFVFPIAMPEDMDFHDLILVIAPHLETKIDEVRANLKKQDLILPNDESSEHAETEDDQD